LSVTALRRFNNADLAGDPLTGASGSGFAEVDSGARALGV
jgi:hypothetical protein